MRSPKPDMGMDVLYLDIESGGKKKQLELEGGKGKIPTPTSFEFDGIKYRLAYGAKPVETPFYIFLRDFQLERYPGSESPASYASEITVLDEEMKVQFDRRIYMNSVMDYRNYRFFQSSYDPDEMGTRLSVNQDFWGTNISYFGYLLLILGMIFTLISPASRFRQINSLLKKIKERKKLVSKSSSESNKTIQSKVLSKNRLGFQYISFFSDCSMNLILDLWVLLSNLSNILDLVSSDEKSSVICHSKLS